MRKLLRKLLGFSRKVHNLYKVSLLKLKGVSLDSSSTIEPGAKVFPGNGTISIGKNLYLGHGVILRTFSGNITIGSNCSLHPYCVVDGGGGLAIGDNVRIAAHTVIVASNHVFSDPDTPFSEQGLSLKGIVIEDDVWLGAGVRVLDGVIVGKGSVVGAGSVVTKSIAPYSVVAGVPARLISSRR